MSLVARALHNVELATEGAIAFDREFGGAEQVLTPFGVLTGPMAWRLLTLAKAKGAVLESKADAFGA